MSTLIRSFASLLLFAGALQSAAGQSALAPLSAGPYRITGTVINSSTGAPVPRCHIAPTKIDQSGAAPRRTAAPQDGVNADDRGHFTLALPSAGSWALLARAPGYRPQDFDQHEGFSSSIVLTEQAPTFDLLFRLAPDSAITGTIRDEANEPVRQAQIQVFAAPPAGVEGERAAVSRGFASTDDRGHYEVGGLASGDYRVTVQARPWYATTSSPVRTAGIPQLDPSLDVVYPLTWYPGVSDGNAAQIVTLHDGETRQADIQLLPIPAFHLRIPAPPSESGGRDGTRLTVRYPQVTSASGNNFLMMSSTTMPQGELDVGGLAPGLYRIQTPDESGQQGRSTLVEINANSSHSLDLASAANTATVDIKIDGGPGTESLPLAFVDASNDRNVFRSTPGGQGGRSPILRSPLGSPRRSVGRLVPAPGTESESGVSSSEQAARTLDLPPGRYLVYQSGSANYFLAGMTQGKKEIPGRLVMIPAGSSSLTLHFATGRATVHGIATLGGKPVVGAMVLLVPITVGEAGSIPEIRRDQTNTDGSFDLNLVIPGQYILIALDHGWDVRWNDPATLTHYLLKGIPLDLRTPSTLKQNVEAQIP